MPSDSPGKGRFVRTGPDIEKLWYKVVAFETRGGSTAVQVSRGVHYLKELGKNAMPNQCMLIEAGFTAFVFSPNPGLAVGSAWFLAKQEGDKHPTTNAKLLEFLGDTGRR